MMLFRSAQQADLESIFQLASNGGTGLSTLPEDKNFLQQRINLSCHSFKKTVDHPGKEYYLFVLEDSETQQVVGTAAIAATIDQEQACYSYKLTKQQHTSTSLGLECTNELLTLVNKNQQCSELCTLFLAPNYRHHGNGSLLSRARFLFMAQYPQRFAKVAMAEVRGAIDESGHSPFWQHVSQHFFPMSLAEAERLKLSSNQQFISELIPTTPLYIKLLAPPAQAAIGKPCHLAQPAMAILLRERFHYQGYTHIFDAGPTIEARVSDILTIKTSYLANINSIDEAVDDDYYLLSNTQLDFRATIAQAKVDSKQTACTIKAKTAALLQLKCGDLIRIAPLGKIKP